MGTMEKCLIKKHHKFLWWEWESEYYNHEWKYIDKETRRCPNCGQMQIFFGKKYWDGNEHEDWRDMP